MSVAKVATVQGGPHPHQRHMELKLAGWVISIIGGR